MWGRGAARDRSGSVSGTAVVPLLLLVGLLFFSSCQAYPELFEADACTSHPTRPKGRHAAPIADTTTTFTLSKRGSTKPEAAVCPGVPYSLVVDFGGARRRALLTASAGRFAAAGALTGSTQCPNRAASEESGPTYSNTLTLPCDTKAAQLLLNATSAGGSSDNFHKASTSMPISPLSSCPGSTCPGAPAATAAAAAPAPAAAAKPAVVPAAAAAAAAAAPQVAARAGAPAQLSASRGSGSGCGQSAYGYACAVDGGQGGMLHYSLSDSPTPPDNVCTASSVDAAAGGSSAGPAAGSQQQQYLHMLLDSPQQGYSGVSFPQTYGKMYPADAVIGYADAANGRPVVSAYHLTDFSPSPSATNSNGLGWASHMGVAKPAGSAGRSLLCFSRPVDAPQAAVSKQLDPSALKLNWVADSGTSFSKEHDVTRSMTIDAAGGTVSSSSGSGGDSKLAKQLAHGALMLLAFTVFMPLGALMARHKWVLGDTIKGGIRPGWFHIHRAVQTLGLLLALAGFILALAAFNVPWSNMSSAAGSTPHKLYNAHRVLGVIVMALCVLQVIGGVVRPGLAHKRRLNWRSGHMLMGWLALVAGVAVVLMGAVMMHDMAGAAYINWLLPILLFLGLVLVAGLVAEAYKSKLERKGVYDPHTHSYAPEGTPSARSSGTGTPEAQISSRGDRFGVDHKHDGAML